MVFSKLPEFIPGIDLNHAFYTECVQPILTQYHPNTAYTAALIGFGSDVIGCDTPMSRDHMWGPRLILFLNEEDFPDTKERINQSLRNHLPYHFKGYPTSFSTPDSIGVRLLQAISSGPVEHLIEITTITNYFDRQLGQARWKNPTYTDWLTFSEHILLSLTAGRVFYDELGLEKVRQNLAYFPKDVWLYQMASAWSAIGQEEPFVGRTGSLGDEIGSHIISARLLNICMRLAFLQEKRYAPYSKWFGTAFQKLNIAAQLSPFLSAVVHARNWQIREENLCQVYELLLNNHNRLKLAKPLDTKCSVFHDRPFRVIHAERAAEQLQSLIQDKNLQEIGLFGSVNQFSASCDLLENINALIQARSIYQP